MLFWDVICPDIFTPSYTSMEVDVVPGQRMKTLKYQTISTIHFFISIRTELSGVFYLYQKLRYRCLIIMGNLAGSEERTVDLLHN